LLANSPRKLHDRTLNTNDGYLVEGVPVDLWMTEWCANVIVKLSKEVSSRLVVADGKDGGDVGTNVAETLRTVALASAVDSRAANKGGGLPDNLAEMTPTVEGSLIINIR